MKNEESTIELWRWKMIRQVANYINQPDDFNVSELKEMIDNYQEYRNIKGYVVSNIN